MTVSCIFNVFTSSHHFWPEMYYCWGLPIPHSRKARSCGHLLSYFPLDLLTHCSFLSLLTLSELSASNSFCLLSPSPLQIDFCPYPLPKLFSQLVISHLLSILNSFTYSATFDTINLPTFYHDFYTVCGFSFSCGPVDVYILQAFDLRLLFYLFYLLPWMILPIHMTICIS